MLHPTCRPKESAGGRAETWELEGDARFELRRRLGAGGLGRVFEVFDRDRRAVVALKILPSIRPENLHRFQREFRSVADLSHPNLLRLHELGCRDGRWFFTMELIAGTDVLRFIRRGPGASGGEATAPDPGFDEHRVRSVFAQIVEGLSVLHEAGALHGGLTAESVLVTAEGRVVLGDFGLEAGLGVEPSRPRHVGTPSYVAPELVRNQPATPASDWYAVGVLLF